MAMSYELFNMARAPRSLSDARGARVIIPPESSKKVELKDAMAVTLRQFEIRDPRLQIKPLSDQGKQLLQQVQGPNPQNVFKMVPSSSGDVVDELDDKILSLSASLKDELAEEDATEAALKAVREVAAKVEVPLDEGAATEIPLAAGEESEVEDTPRVVVTPPKRRATKKVT